MKIGSVSIDRAMDPNSIRTCQDVMATVFHDELRLHGMAIPDSYEDHSIYVALRSDGSLAGTFRVVKPNNDNQCPATDVWPNSDILPAGNVCQFSRVAILPQFRRHGLFRMAVNAVEGIARDIGASLVLSDVLLQSRLAYERCGFDAAGDLICDPTVDTFNTGELNCVPMILQVL